MDTTATTPALDTPRSLRVRLGLDQVDLQALAHVSDRTIREIEHGRNVNVSSISAVSKPLGVTPGALLDALLRVKALRASRRMFRARLHKTGMPLAKYGKAAAKGAVRS